VVGHVTRPRARGPRRGACPAPRTWPTAAEACGAPGL